MSYFDKEPMLDDFMLNDSYDYEAYDYYHGQWELDKFNEEMADAYDEGDESYDEYEMSYDDYGMSLGELLDILV